jgi:DNA-binding NarL/FixJ family response regulator
MVQVTNTTPSCGLLVVDDHGIVREGLTAMFRQQVGIQVLGSANSGEEAICEALRLQPAIVIMVTVSS